MFIWSTVLASNHWTGTQEWTILDRHFNFALLRVGWLVTPFQHWVVNMILTTAIVNLMGFMCVLFNMWIRKTCVQASIFTMLTHDGVCMHVYVYVRTYVCMYVCMYVCTYVCMYVCMYVCTYACVFMHACMYVRTHVVYVCMHVSGVQYSGIISTCKFWTFSMHTICFSY